MLVSDVGFQGRINLLRRGAGRVCVSEFLWVSSGYIIHDLRAVQDNSVGILCLCLTIWGGVVKWGSLGCYVHLVG